MLKALPNSKRRLIVLNRNLLSRLGTPRYWRLQATTGSPSGVVADYTPETFAGALTLYSPHITQLQSLETGHGDTLLFMICVKQERSLIRDCLFRRKISLFVRLPTRYSYDFECLLRLPTTLLPHYWTLQWTSRPGSDTSPVWELVGANRKLFVYPFSKLKQKIKITGKHWMRS